MRKESTTRLLHLARQFAAEPAGISLDEIVTRFSVSRRTAERTRDPIAEVFRQLEELAGERPKRWRLPNQALCSRLWASSGHLAATSGNQECGDRRPVGHGESLWSFGRQFGAFDWR
jgi:hypothetical protein